MTATEAPVPLFDAEVVEKLRQVAGPSDPGFIADVARVFLEEATGLVAEIRQAASAGDWSGASRGAHSVKSSAATLGLLRLSGACRALEMAIRAGRHDETSTLAEAVSREFDAVLPIVRSIR